MQVFRYTHNETCFKHGSRRGQSLQFNGAHFHFPDTWLTEFIHTRRTVQATLFAYLDGTPVLRRHCDSSLWSLLALQALSVEVLKGYIGYISSIINGESDALITPAGLCASDAFR